MKHLDYYLGVPLAIFTISYDRACGYLDNMLGKFLSITATGQNNIPAQGPAIVAPNHESALEILLLAPSVKQRHLHFIAKKELWETDKWYGHLLKKQIEKWYALPINRQKPGPSQVKPFIKAIEEEHVVAIFPEGTRSPGLGEFHDFVAMLSYNKDVPVVPTGLVGTKAAEDKLKYFWKHDKNYLTKLIFDKKNKLYRPYVEINFGEPIYCKSCEGENKKQTFQRFNAELREKIASLMKLEEKVMS